MGLPISSGGRGKRIARSAPKEVRITALKERQRGPETFALPWSMLWKEKKKIFSRQHSSVFLKIQTIFSTNIAGKKRMRKYF